MRLSVNHTTRYEYSEPAVHGMQRLRLRPKDTHGQEILEWTTTIDGGRIEVEYDDQHHNHTALVSVDAGVQTVTISCTGVVETSDHSGVIGEHAGHMPLWAFLRPTNYTRAGNRVRALVASVEEEREDLVSFLHALSAAVREAIDYEPGITDSETTAEQALTAGRGVCQDHAHVFISAGRLLDIPMRYVGGYLKMDDRIDQEAGHGWAEAHVQGLGWVGFDVSNGISPDERYVRVATGCDYSEAAPVTGIAWGAGEIALDVSLSVEHRPASQQQQQQQTSN